MQKLETITVFMTKLYSSGTKFANGIVAMVKSWKKYSNTSRDQLMACFCLLFSSRVVPNSSTHTHLVDFIKLFFPSEKLLAHGVCRKIWCSISPTKLKTKIILKFANKVRTVAGYKYIRNEGNCVAWMWYIYWCYMRQIMWPARVLVTMRGAYLNPV